MRTNFGLYSNWCRVTFQPVSKLLATGDYPNEKSLLEHDVIVSSEALHDITKNDISLTNSYDEMVWVKMPYIWTQSTKILQNFKTGNYVTQLAFGSFMVLIARIHCNICGPGDVKYRRNRVLTPLAGMEFQ